MAGNVKISALPDVEQSKVQGTAYFPFSDKFDGSQSYETKKMSLEQIAAYVGATAPEVQIGGEEPSSESEIKLYVDTNSSDSVIFYTIQEVDGRFIAIVNSQNTPTSSTLTYQLPDGTVKNFKEGDEIRVPDLTSDTGYTFYKLYKLETVGNVTTATWDMLGAGSDEVQIGGNTPGSDSDIKLFVDENDDPTVEVYTKTQVDGQFIVIVNSVSEPTSSTLTYTATDGTTKSFKVGDEIRVPDQDAENGYTFYKLYKLETVSDVTTATWDKVGAGSSVNPNETVNISLTQVGGNSADLIGASITITDDDSGDTLYTATWAGTMITTEIDVNTNYTVSVETIAGYSHPSSVSYQAGYQTERNISFNYASMGVYIEATDHTLYTSSSWTSSGKTANAVVVITDTLKKRISLYHALKSIHSEQDASITSFLAGKTLEQAKIDYNGKTNTDAIIEFNKVKGTNTDTYAAPYCKNFVFPNGESGGYLPAAGEYSIVANNYSGINACLVAAGGNAFNDNMFLTSTTTTESPYPIWRLRPYSLDQLSTTNIGAGLYFHVFSDYE